MSVPFPHTNDFVIGGMEFSPELVEMFWKTAHILHTIVFEENGVGAFPLFIEPEVYESNNIERVRVTREYNYKIKFKLRLDNDQQIFGKISLFLESFTYDSDYSSDHDSEITPETNRLGLFYELQTRENGITYRNFEDLFPHYFGQYPGYEKPILKLWLSSPFVVIDAAARGERKYAFSNTNIWHGIFMRKLRSACEKIDEENNAQERIAGIMTERTRTYKAAVPTMRVYSDRPDIMYMIRQEIKKSTDKQIEDLTRNRNTLSDT
jgi:hypothetical protein